MKDIPPEMFELIRPLELPYTCIIKRLDGKPVRFAETSTSGTARSITILPVVAPNEMPVTTGCPLVPIEVADEMPNLRQRARRHQVPDDQSL